MQGRENMKLSRREFIRVAGIAAATFVLRRTAYAGVRSATPRGKLRHSSFLEWHEDWLDACQDFSRRPSCLPERWGSFNRAYLCSHAAKQMAA